MSFSVVDSARTISCQVSIVATISAVAVIAAISDHVSSVAPGHRDHSTETSASAP